MNNSIEDEFKFNDFSRVQPSETLWVEVKEQNTILLLFITLHPCHCPHPFPSPACIHIVTVIKYRVYISNTMIMTMSFIF